MIALAEEIEQLAQRLAEHDGTTPANVIREALEVRARAAGNLSRPRRRPDFARMLEISDASARLPVLDCRTPEAIVGYNAFGVPE